MKKVLYLLLTAIFCCSFKNDPVLVADHQILPHPRLLFPLKNERDVKVLIRENALAKDIYARLLEEAERFNFLPYTIVLL